MSIHSICGAERSAFVRHINAALAQDSELAHILPINPHDDSIFTCVSDGILLCKLIEVSVPGTLDASKISQGFRGQKGTKFLMLENHNLCLAAARSIGCSIVNISGEDLLEGKPYLVFGLLWQIIRAALLYHVNVRTHPELLRLLSADEDIRNIPQEAILMRWFNWHLERSGYPAKISNFCSDLSDSIAYAYLLHSLNPQIMTEARLNQILDVQDPNERARLLLEIAALIDPDCRTFLNPEDIVAGREKLNLCFIASLFNKGTGMAVLHEELESKVKDLEFRLQQMENENRKLKRKLGDKSKENEMLLLENGELKRALQHTLTYKDQLQNKIEEINDKLSSTSDSLVKTQKELTQERRQAETFGLCADSLADELETFRSRQEKLEYLVEHLKMERERSDANIYRLRILYKTFPNTEALCRAIYCDISGQQKLTLDLVSNNAVKTGLMTKKARDGSNWQIRHLVLRDNFLFYFKTEKDTRAEARGVIRLDDANIQYCDNPTKSNLQGQLILCIDCPDYGYAKDSKRCRFYIAGPNFETELWREALQKAAAWWTRKSSIQSMQAEMRRRASTLTAAHVVPRPPPALIR